MRKLLTVLIAGTLMTGLLAPQAMSFSKEKRQEARFQMHDGRRGWSTHDVRVAIRWGAARFGVPLSTALMIAERESGFNEHARNPSSQACGVYQQLPEYWRGRRNHYNATHPHLRVGRAGCENARANILVSLSMMGAPGGLSHWGF